MATKKVIDVSYHNGTIDWVKVKAAGISGAIIRCGYGDNIASQDDKQWKRNADECTRLGIPFGTYIYSYAKTEEQARSEAQHVLRLIKGYKLSYPVYLDLEEPGTQSGAAQRMKIFADIIEKAGYWCGLYCNKSWWDNYLKFVGGRYTKWIARYNNTLGMDGVDMWQYTSDGSVSGISGRVDMNYCYRDFPKEIGSGTSSGGPDKESEQSPAGTTLDLVYRTMKGDFGNGDTRKKNLGERYDEVMSVINHIATASASTLANEVKAGEYGNGDVRKVVLGLRYNEVQKIVNNGTTSYYKKFNNSSLVDGLKSIGVDSSFSNRKKIAKANGISNYEGTTSQNNKLCSLAKQGKLKKE